MGTISMLTTVDNPHDPFDEYDEWYAWDIRSGYNTAGYLARIAVVSDDLTEADLQASLEDAIDEIVELNPTGMHRKVTREVEFEDSPRAG